MATTPRSSISPPRTTTTPPPPPSNAVASAGGQDPEDPFLAQTAAIPLTERDRQEGYDVELLNARPRGGAGTLSDAAGGDGDSLLATREKYSSAGLAAPVGAAAGVGLPLGATTGASYGGGLPGSGGKEFDLSGGGGGGGSSGTTAKTGRRRPWFLRPLPLGILAAFIVAVALAIGLGVGLSERSRHAANAAASRASSSRMVSGGSRSRTGSRTRTGSATTGTVVPSSLYSSYTSEHPQSDESSSSSSDSETATDSESSTATDSLTTIPSPASGTTLASTGNLPIPAGSATTISGSITVSRLSPSEATEAAGSTITARAKLRRQKRWNA
ncbi:uncharacterized protein JCM6883_002685 [Sporobolomyces salmoneus]|uniref:uncharacterized protein n=1 Tax=Sporobolomyces salmoneus TaxID=183962 RepID=UPI0031824C53